MNADETEIAGTVHSTHGLSLAELQQTAAYLKYLATFRSRGIWSLIWGIISIGIGYASLEANPLNIILLLLGMLLCGEGVWFLIRPMPMEVISYGFSMIGVGLWNIIIPSCNFILSRMHQSSDPLAFLHSDLNPFPILVGILQLVWGFQEFGQYKRSVKLYKMNPSAEQLAGCQAILTQLKSTSMDTDPQAIQFSCIDPDAIRMSSAAWIGCFVGTQVMLLNTKDHESYFLENNAFDIVPEEPLTEKKIVAVFKIGSLNVIGSITPEALARYAQWKAAVS